MEVPKEEEEIRKEVQILQVLYLQSTRPLRQELFKGTVRTRMWTLVGARIARFWITRLGIVHLLVGTRDGHA
ncbi:hypothetical protein CRG98_030838 [Punica granatum]|uniref:Uncharacterized protein n=1 Tax=Punica granatum TaxID=22663 RepID=A0A2I0IZF6_PUNGR|nr:hypothetical protein CRG98_030838 [Punica granatum]